LKPKGPTTVIGFFYFLTPGIFTTIIIIINVFAQRHKIVTSEALLRKGKRESPGEEECL